MKRNPSIHITKLQFENILSYLEIDNFPVEAFFVVAKKEAINSRVVDITTKKANKQISNTLLASQGDAALVADIIYSVRIKLKHRGVRKIQETNTRDWNACKKLAAICNDFCSSFELNTRGGFIKYIELGISRMTDHRNMIQRLISMSENIFSVYSSVEELEGLSMSDKEDIKDIHNYYIKKLADRTGIYESLENFPEKMIHFKKLRDFLSSKGWLAYYAEYIDAQFEALTWCNGLPEIQNLYNEKAIERYNKYLFKKNKPTNQEEESPEVEGSLWDKIR